MPCHARGDCPVFWAECNLEDATNWPREGQSMPRSIIAIHPLELPTPIRCSRVIFDFDVVTADKPSFPSCELVLLSSIASLLAASRAALRCSYAAMSSALSDSLVAGRDSMLTRLNCRNTLEEMGFVGDSSCDRCA